MHHEIHISFPPLAEIPSTLNTQEITHVLMTFQAWRNYSDIISKYVGKCSNATMLILCLQCDYALGSEPQIGK